VAEKVHQPGIALQVIAQPGLVIIYDLMQEVDGRRIISGTEIQHRDFIIENKYAVAVDKQ
jgi:hypothetical protein